MIYLSGERDVVEEMDYLLMMLGALVNSGLIVTPLLLLDE